MARYLAMLIGIVFVVGCSATVFTQKAELDTPSRHVENGIRLLNYGKIEDAFREFDRAKILDENYASAYVGMAFCYGLMGDYDKGIETMKAAQQLIRSKPR